MITREQVQDLQPGDVVELSGHPSQFGSTVRGPLYEQGGELYVGDRLVRYIDGSVNHTYAGRMHLTVVSRVPRPLYVNHPRTKPVPGDVVRDADDDTDARTWCHDGTDRVCWQQLNDGAGDFYKPKSLPARLRLLVDGQTGQVVQ